MAQFLTQFFETQNVYVIRNCKCNVLKKCDSKLSELGVL